MSAYIEIPSRNPGGGGGGISSVSWGTILGTLSDQTDLNTALGLKAPLANPIFSGVVGTAEGTNLAPSLALGDPANQTGFYTSGAGTQVQMTCGGTPSFQLNVNQMGCATIFYMNVRGAAAQDNFIQTNSPNDSITLAGDYFGDRTRGGWIRAGGRAAVMGETVQIATVATVGIGLTADQMVILGSSTNPQQHILNTLLSTSSNGLGTLANLPAGMSGNPAGFVKMLINGKISAIPFFQ